MSTEPKRGTCDAISANYHLRPHVQTPWCVNWREGESAPAQACIDCGQPESDKAHDPDCPSIIDRHEFEAVPPAPAQPTITQPTKTEPLLSSPRPFLTTKPCTYQEHAKRIATMLAEGLHDGKQWKPEAHERYRELEQAGVVPPAAETARQDKLMSNWIDPRFSVTIEDLIAASPQETAITAEQDIQQVLDFYNSWHDHSDDFTPDRDTVGLVLAYAAHVREAAQGEIERAYDAGMGEGKRTYKTDLADARGYAQKLERKLAEQDDQIAALKELLERYLGKLAELEKAMCKVGDIAVAALASLRAESKEG